MSSAQLFTRQDRRKATRQLFSLSLPIYVTQLAQLGISTLAIVLAGRCSTVDLAAVSLSGNLWMPLYILINGIIMALTPIVAQFNGANRIDEVRQQVNQSAWIAVVLGIITGLILVLLTPEALRLMHVADNVQLAAHHYMIAASVGMPALALFQTLRSCSEGMGNTRVALGCVIISLLLSIPLGMGLVFGYVGLPPLGALGCGITSAFFMWCNLILMLVYFSKSSQFSHLNLLQQGVMAPDLKVIKHLLKLGLPIGISMFSEVLMFAVIALLIATYGTIAIAAHEVAINISALLYMGPLSLGMGLTICVGIRLGEGNAFLARKESLNGIRLSIMVALFNAIIVLALGHWLASLYSTQSAVIELSVALLHLAILFQLSDAIQSILGGALRGYKDTHAVMVITLIAYWIVGLGTGLPLGFGIPTLWQGLGIYGFWIGMIIGLTASALMLFIRIRKTARRYANRALNS